MNSDEALVPEAAIGIGAGEEQEHVGPGAEGAPRLHAVEQPAAVGAGGAGGDGGGVAAHVGLGDGDGVQHLGGGELGQPLVLLLLGAAGDQRPGEDLRPGDEAAAGAEAAAAQLLGGDDHADVLGLAAAAVAAVLLGDRQAEGAHLAETADDVLGDVVVVAVDVLGDRLELVLGEAAEGVLHQLEVVVEVPGALLPGERGEEGRVAVGGAEGAGAVEGADLDAPRGLAPEEPAGQLADGVGHEGAGDLRLELAVGAVVEHRVRRLDGGGGVGEVVAEHLVDVGPAAGLAGCGCRCGRPGGRAPRPPPRRSDQQQPSAKASEAFSGPRNPRKALATPAGSATTVLRCPPSGTALPSSPTTRAAAARRCCSCTPGSPIGAAGCR